jgi:acyl-CoA synthetase (AMP-forming)/AMP-acid ligase II
VTAPYKYPREIEFVADLPKTISGKIRRTELRQMERDRSSQKPSPPKGDKAGDQIPSPPKGERAG